MKYCIIYFLTSFLLFQWIPLQASDLQDTIEKSITIENAELKLIIGSDGKALSLIHKPSGQECLQTMADHCSNTSVFSITEYRPSNGDIHLVYPSKSTVFQADSVFRSGEDIIVRFEMSNWVATIGLKVTDYYIGFSLKKMDYVKGYSMNDIPNPVDEVTILQLPVRKREFFGEWLNVVWDKDVAINILATDPYAKIDAIKYNDYNFLQASAVKDVKLIGVGAALITTTKKRLLDDINQLEHDFNLPLGVESRRKKDIACSYLWLSSVSTKNIDEYIAIAKKAGFRGIQIYWPAIFKTLGHYQWRDEYPNGMADLQTITRKIKEAGMIAGFHIQHSKVSINDVYVSPVPDHRLNLLRTFTLAASLDKEATTITVEENPEGSDLMTAVMWEKKRILKIGTELIEYTDYTKDRPYQFIGCTRGILNTKVSEYGLGYKFGLLDMDGQPAVRLDQRTSIQQEHAERIAQISNEAGFQFFSYDGAEDVHTPWWFWVSMSQYEVHKRLHPEPLFSTGAAKSHFDWHILTCSNEFDTFDPEVIKEATIKHQVSAARYIAQDFTHINFGWVNYVAPGEKTIGMQPDMFEYVCSRSAAWDCPISLKGNLKAIKAHPRTNDNLEVIRRWEVARTNNFFSDEQKKLLQDSDLEYILLINEKGGFELQPYNQIPNVAGGSSIRAFVFDRLGKTYAVFWHTSGAAKIALNIHSDKINLFKELGKKISVKKIKEELILPVGDRQYLEVDIPRDQVIAAFTNARIL